MPKKKTETLHALIDRILRAEEALLRAIMDLVDETQALKRETQMKRARKGGGRGKTT